jgi:hypothetical protein
MIRVRTAHLVLPTALVALLAMALTASTGRAQQPVTYYGLAFPESIAGAARGPAHDYESTHPGLGYSVNYTRPGWTIDVYIYDLGRASVPDDAGSQPVKEQLAAATRDVLNRPGGPRVEARLRYAILDHEARPRFLCTAFTLLPRQGPNPVDSYLCVTSWQSKFVKFRLSTAQRPGSESVANGFVQAWMKVLWPS